MQSRDKQLLKVDVMVAYGTCIKPLYIKWGQEGYKTNEIRLEIMKILLDHTMLRVTETVYKDEKKKAAKRDKKIRAKRKVEEAKILMPEYEKDLFEGLVEAKEVQNEFIEKV